MRDQLNRIKSNQFLLSLSTLISGSVIAQVITILLSPLITRLFSPEQFGLYTIIITAVSLFGPIICLKYDMAIIGANNIKETFSIIKLCFILIFPISFIISISYSLLVFNGFNKKTEVIWYSFVIFILLLTYGLNNVLLAYNNKSRSYNLIASVTIIKSSVNNFILLITGFLNLGSVGLILSQIISSIVGVRKQSKEIRKKLIYLKKTSLYNMKSVFIKYINFPMFNATSAIINTSIYSSINLFIAMSFSLQQLGYYSISYRVLGIPFMIISANVARIFFERATKEKNEKGNFNSTFNKTFKIIAIVIIPTIVLLAILAPTLFPIIFGHEWGIAGIYIALLSPMFAIRLIGESLTTSFIVAGKQNVELQFQLTLMIGQLIIYIFTYYLNIQIETFFVCISFLYVIVQSIMIIYMKNLSEKIL
ncbi:oligosaccharide flippase family protein [Salinicoccus halodurans]|uniref:Membrane protein involved in the export of O-antigen and teichoic acid n=1 Tax=Salinicoccus halodurans TaxID=407035 RepID=A0A0F7HL14_9STAP|nr:oligosaccharide flippase family protein [Salinicoccus halodurans]AKG73463.1 hypothetical protein AAT16_04080 [Salinicoccus halodurans]SFK50962.1 Membrane protein involved in the export of O-antigen and teichoic acid [Salinicoccus halodurans]